MTSLPICFSSAVFVCIAMSQTLRVSKLGEASIQSVCSYHEWSGSATAALFDLSDSINNASPHIIWAVRPSVKFYLHSVSFCYPRHFEWMTRIDDYIILLCQHVSSWKYNTWIIGDNCHQLRVQCCSTRSLDLASAKEPHSKLATIAPSHKSLF